MNEHIVNFNKYCSRCKFQNYPEAALPCHECLNETVAMDSDRPVKYKPTDEWVKKEKAEKERLLLSSKSRLRRD